MLKGDLQAQKFDNKFLMSRCKQKHYKENVRVYNFMSEVEEKKCLETSQFSLPFILKIQIVISIMVMKY